MFGSLDWSQSLVRRLGSPLPSAWRCSCFPWQCITPEPRIPLKPMPAYDRPCFAGSPAVDVIVDGAVVASNLTFGQITDAISVSPDAHQLQIVPTGQDAASAVIDTSFDPEGGKTYIVAAAGLLKDIEAKVYDVHSDDLDAGKSRLRLINLSQKTRRLMCTRPAGMNSSMIWSSAKHRTIPISTQAPTISKFARMIRRLPH